MRLPRLCTVCIKNFKQNSHWQTIISAFYKHVAPYFFLMSIHWLVTYHLSFCQHCWRRSCLFEQKFMGMVGGQNAFSVIAPVVTGWSLISMETVMLAVQKSCLNGYCEVFSWTNRRYVYIQCYSPKKRSCIYPENLEKVLNVFLSHIFIANVTSALFTWLQF